MNETRKQSSGNSVVPLRPNETVVATVSLLAFIGAVVLLFAALMSPTLAGTPPLDIHLTVSASLALMVPALVCIFFRCHARLVFGETGLRWRTWGDWRRTTWNGVRDYCDLPPRTGSSDRLMTIQTDAGDVILSRKWRESEAVRQAVQARATEAAVTEWGVQEERSHAADTRTFRYGQKDFWVTLLLGGGFFLPLYRLRLVLDTASARQQASVRWCLDARRFLGQFSAVYFCRDDNTVRTYCPQPSSSHLPCPPAGDGGNAETPEGADYNTAKRDYV